MDIMIHEFSTKIYNFNKILIFARGRGRTYCLMAGAPAFHAPRLSVGASARCTPLFLDGSTPESPWAPSIPHENVRLHFLEIEPSYPYNVKTRCFQWVSSLLYIAARGAPSTYDRAGRYARPHTSQTQVLRTGVLTGLPAV